MKQKRSALTLTISLVLAVGISGCKSPQKIRAFSQMQLAQQQAFRDSMRIYFQAVLDLAKAVGEKSKKNVGALSKENVGLLQEQAAEDLGDLKQLSERKARLAKLSGDIEEQLRVRQESTQKIDGDYEGIQKKTQELLSALDALVDAQEALNTYVHTKSIDEKLLGGLQDRVSEKLGIVSQISKDVTATFGLLQKGLK
jgi:hypothetical protein